MEKSKLILSQLSSAKGKRDEEANIELAQKIADQQDSEAVDILIKALTGKDKSLHNNCIKVLYEIGYIQPKLISPYFSVFKNLLRDKNNRLQWGAMTALSSIAPVKPEETYEALPELMEAADKGSVITRDQAVSTLINLASLPAYTEGALSLLLEQLKKSPENQLPMYAEKILTVIDEAHKELFRQVLHERLKDVEKESRVKRLKKVITKLTKK